MSLVSYGASDDSESEEDNNDDQLHGNANPDSKESNVTKENGVESDSENDSQPTLTDVNDLLKGLPEPKGISKLSGIPECDELEEEVKPKPAQIAAAPKPPPKKVTITVPALVPEEDDENPRKRLKSTKSQQGKCGLFSLLPPPIHAATKETNRLLLPHSFYKKSTPATKPLPKQPQKSAMAAGKTESDSDDDEQQTNFFSLNTDKSESQHKPVYHKLTLPPPISSTLPPPISSLEPKHSPQTDLVYSNHINDSVPNSTFQDSSSQQNVYSPEPISSSSQSSYIDDSEIHSVQNFGVESEENEFQKMLNSEEFLKLQGKKQRGKESINIVDVNADDFIGTVDVCKSLSEEKVVRSSHKKGEGPTSQQKRKHQITYLAHQAKEREIELKNEWSQNRLTKRQTQAKYGF